MRRSAWNRSMTRPTSGDDALQAANLQGATLQATSPRAARKAVVPASLQAEYQELSHKREQLRAALDRARAELAELRKAKAR
jgi:hypothetical protein